MLTVTAHVERHEAYYQFVECDWWTQLWQEICVEYIPKNY